MPIKIAKYVEEVWCVGTTCWWSNLWERNIQKLNILSKPHLPVRSKFALVLTLKHHSLAC